MRAKYQDNLENMQVRNIYHAPLGHFLLCILSTHSCVTLTSCHITGMFPSLISLILISCSGSSPFLSAITMANRTMPCPVACVAEDATLSPCSLPILRSVAPHNPPLAPPRNVPPNSALPKPALRHNKRLSARLLASRPRRPPVSTPVHSRDCKNCWDRSTTCRSLSNRWKRKEIFILGRYVLCEYCFFVTAFLKRRSIDSSIAVFISFMVFVPLISAS